MAYPVVEGYITGEINVAASTHTITLPSSIQAGELLICFFTAGTNSAIANVYTGSSANWKGGGRDSVYGYEIDANLFWAKALGSGGDTLVLETLYNGWEGVPVSAKSSWICYRISGWKENLYNDPEWEQRWTNGHSLSYDLNGCPEVDDYVSKDYLYLICVGSEADSPAIDLPTYYTDLITITGEHGGGASTSSCRKNDTASYSNPFPLVRYAPSPEVDWEGVLLRISPEETLPAGVSVINFNWRKVLTVPIDFVSIEYGLLYNWYAATDARNITSIGWHIPTQIENQTLITTLGGVLVAGGHLKEIGFVYWSSPNTGADNSSGFNQRGNGRRRDDNGLFESLMQSGEFWSNVEYGTDPSKAYYCQAGNSGSTSAEWNIVHDKKWGIAVRPIKDSTTLSDGETGIYIGNDGKIYRTICIGTQEWLSDNLAETKYRNDDLIPEVTDNTAWAALGTGALCAYNNDWDNV